MIKINKRLFPIKMHYFFFMAAMGPILPFYPLIGKQLGLSEAALGSITAVFPLLYLILKPFVGFLADYFFNLRKFMFLGFIIGTCVSFDLLATIQDSVTTIPCESIYKCNLSLNDSHELCRLKCGVEHKMSKILRLNNGKLCSVENQISNLSSVINYSSEVPNYNNCSNMYKDKERNLCLEAKGPEASCQYGDICTLDCMSSKLYFSQNFWIFTILTSLGCIFFNITNFYSDAICFDVLGDGNEKKYGYQRVWGTLGFGLTALISGYAIESASRGLPYQNFMPIFLLASVCISMDLYFSCKLKLPELSKSESIIKDVKSVIFQPRVAFFLVFATFVGILDSSIFYFLLWYIEDLAIKSGSISDIKLLQGLTVALENLVGEAVSFFLSSKILKKIGYAHSLSLGFMFYSLRLGLLGLITEPWLVLPIELLQGPSYALLYSTIVAYASSVTPPGTSGTIQGLVAGMDDGLGLSLGSLIGGFVYTYYSGRTLFLLYSWIALLCALIHFIGYMSFFRKQLLHTSDSNNYHAAATEDVGVELTTLNNEIKIVKQQV